MARMQPDDIESHEDATEGEKRVFRFIKEAARPHKDFICWYEPPIGSSGKEPDFILFGKKLGLLVIEVKDWSSQQIISYNPHQFTIRISGKTEQKTNPDKQAKGYVNTLKERLEEFPEFLSDHPKYRGKLKIPIGRMVVFTNISRNEYADSRKLQKRISGAFLFQFEGLTQKEIEKLSFILWPEAKIDLPPRLGSGKTRFQREVLALDESQARLALRIGPGHQIIKGPPGSGKTLVLVHRCRHLCKYNPKVKKILLVCYNIALVGYLKRLLQEKGLGIGKNGIEVCHFYELCAWILGETVHFENEDSDYYGLVTRETFEKVLNGRSLVGPFDAILVDEGQDFDKEMLKILLNLLRPRGDLVVCLDSYQDVYRRKFSWKSLGIKASGRTQHLRKVYRNTAEIFDFTQRFIGETPKIEKQLALLPYGYAFHGDPPELHRFKNREELDDFLVKDLDECIAQREYKRSEIAVIYDDKVYGPDRFAYDNRELPMRILNKLETSGIPTAWVSRDVRSKEMYDITTDRVSLISIHSSKGLDFELVYLINIDHIRPTEETMDSLISLVYVAMTRAKYRLVIPYIEETEFIKRMKDCLPDEK